MLSIRTRNGFTLPELLLSAALLGFVLSAILSLFINSIDLNHSSRNLTVATSHAQYILENVKATAFGSITSSIAASTWNWNSTGLTSQGLTPLNAETTVVTSAGTNPLTITVTVNWRDLKNRAKSISLRTVISG